MNRDRAPHVAELHVERVSGRWRRTPARPAGSPTARRTECRSSPDRDLNSSTDAYGHRNTLWPFTVISNAMLPTAGMIETEVCVFVSWS